MKSAYIRMNMSGIFDKPLTKYDTMKTNVASKNKENWFVVYGDVVILPVIKR